VAARIAARGDVPGAAFVVNGSGAARARLTLAVLLLLAPSALVSAQPADPDAASPASQRSLADDAMRVTLAVNVGASLASTVFTYRCVGEGLCRERNPLMRDLAHDRPAAGIALKVAEICAVNYLLWRLHQSGTHRKWVWLTALGITAFNVGLAIHDGHVYRRQRARY
jgi:hypothetical protein